MNYDRFLTRGLDGTDLWNTIRHRCATHHDMLDEMRSRQKAMAVAARVPSGEKRKTGISGLEESLLRDVLFLETMAWRLFMFGSRSLFSPYPGKDGEYEKRRRTDPAYWKMRALCGQKKADKWIKRVIRQEWERTVLKRYKY